MEIPQPKNTITTEKIFTNDAQAKSAMAGVLTLMINGSGQTGGISSFSNGWSTIAGGLSSDEFNSQTTAIGDGNYMLSANKLNANTGLPPIWDSAYQSINGANAIIEGIAASTSPGLRLPVRTQLTAEAKFIRAFSYFYLVNFFGDLPLVLTTDFNKTLNISRSSTSVIYQQIILDLNDALAGLPTDYSATAGERIRPTKWAAKALLARVYLFTGDRAKALVECNEVINQTALYQVEMTDLNKVFLRNSSEAIWQLQQNTQVSIGTATPEGDKLLPSPLHTGITNVTVSPSLLAAFEPGDLRKSAWLDSAIYTLDGMKTIFPYKYKTGTHNREVGVSLQSPEYYMVLRISEQYLIRAEINAANGQIGAAIADLNILRKRSGLGDLSTALTQEQALAAVAKEKRIELFGEWGHRWFDLKRTGKAHDVLSVIPTKQPWQGDYQLLYPIPPSEILRNKALSQNPNY